MKISIVTCLFSSFWGRIASKEDDHVSMLRTRNLNRASDSSPVHEKHDIESRIGISDFTLVGEFLCEQRCTGVGGLSGITFNADEKVFYAVSAKDIPRFYTLKIDHSKNDFNEEILDIVSVTKFTDEFGDQYQSESLEAGGIAYSKKSNTIFVSSLGNGDQNLPPALFEFSLDGKYIRELSIPSYYIPDINRTNFGIQGKKGFSSLSFSPNQKYIRVGIEQALQQDRNLEDETLSRMMLIDVESGKAVTETVYPIDTIPNVSTPKSVGSSNGLVELVALDNNGSYLALERTFSVGMGFDCRIFYVKAQGALDTLSYESFFRNETNTLYEIDPPARKELLIHLSADNEFGIIPGNLEGMVFVRRKNSMTGKLILISNNSVGETQFIAFELNIKKTPLGKPLLETPLCYIDADLAQDKNVFAGDSDDPAFWIHPSDPNKSLVIATLKGGGLIVFDLTGKPVQEIFPSNFGEVSYNNVDVMYAFYLGGVGLIDIVVASDRVNDEIAIWMIDKDSGILSDVTSFSSPQTIFSIDDGEATAYGLTTFVSQMDYAFYVYVTQASGNLVAQLKLYVDAEEKINYGLVRMIELPVPTGDLEDSQAEGMVADRESGTLYIAMETEVGVLKIDAEPDGGTIPEIIIDIKNDYFAPDLEGISMYYGEDGDGYLLVSSQGDSSYAVFSRDTNEYIGSFGIGSNDNIDQINETDGFDVINVRLGDNFPRGLAVFQDGKNDPQAIVPDDEELENVSTNFKFVPWENIAKSFDEELDIDTSSDPRTHNMLIILDLAIVEAEFDNNYKETAEYLEDAKDELEKKRNRKAIKELRDFVGEVKDVMDEGGDQDLGSKLLAISESLIMYLIATV